MSVVCVCVWGGVLHTHVCVFDLPKFNCLHSAAAWSFSYTVVTHTNATLPFCITQTEKKICLEVTDWRRS